MLFHLIHHAVQVLEEFYMAQLIQFIMTDDLEVHVLLCLFEVCLRRNESCNSGSRIAYFRSGYELIDHIRISGFLALLDDVQQVILSVIIQVMDNALSQKIRKSLAAGFRFANLLTVSSE